jgi:hypothetical protein
LKKRYKVLLVAQEYPLINQAQIIFAVAFLHNFLIVHDPDEIIMDDVETEASVDDDWSSYQSSVPAEERNRAAEHRDRITQQMWADYTVKRARRHR